MTTLEKTGADLQTQLPIPIVDLAKIVERIVTTVKHQNNWLLNHDKNLKCLTIDFNSILTQLGNSSELITILSPMQSTHKSIYVGGHIKQDSELKLKKALTELQHILQHQFTALLDEDKLTLNQFIASASNWRNTLVELGRQVGGHPDRLNQVTTRIQPTQFTLPNTNTHSKRLARVISAVEIPEVGDKLESLLAAITRLMQQKTDYDVGEINSFVENIRNNYRQQYDTQLQKFIRLLDEDTFAVFRLRLGVAMEIMETVQWELEKKPDLNSKLAAEYIRRIVKLYKTFVNEIGIESKLELDLTQDYGSGARFLLTSELSKVGFYSCLPIWCSWNLSLLETNASNKGAIQRHIGYRFKVNGKDSETKQSAYKLRLTRLTEVLVSETVSTKYSEIARSLTQLLFLATVIPKHDEEFGVDIVKKFQSGAEFLNKHGKNAVRQILNNLDKRIDRVKQIAGSIIKILKLNKSLFSQHSNRSHNYYCNILPGILNQEHAFSGMSEILVKSTDNQDQRTVWYDQIRVTVNTPLQNALFSIKIDVIIKETLLCEDGNPLVELPCYRDNDSPIMQVIWQPVENSISLQAQANANKWRFAYTITTVITYDPALLENMVPKPSKSAQTQLAVQRIAYTVLVYMALKIICEHVKSQLKTSLIVSMLRLQTSINIDEKSQRMQGLYAIAHAVEHALGQHLRVRMQGLTIDRTNNHVNRTTFNALLSGLPLKIATQHLPTIENIGVLSLISRPVTEHPELTQSTDKKFILIGRSYHAKILDNSTYQLIANANLTALEAGSDSFDHSPAIMNAIQRLYKIGCKHIIYMGQSQAWNQWRFSSNQYRYHFAPEFFASIENNFPELQLYPLTHDVFPATRLNKRDNQDAFEVSDYQSLLKVWGVDFNLPSYENLNKSLIPIYSLATLNIVGSDNDERPQSGFATYFLITDDNQERLEKESRKRLDLITTDSAIRKDIIAILRGIHYLESEAINTKDTHVRPVLHPFSTLRPANIAEVGEVVIHESNKKTGQVVLSLSAILARITNVLDTKS
jgi:hypothetical protein